MTSITISLFSRLVLLRVTYGVANDNGTPDLIAAIATNGRTGYVYARDLEQPAPTTLQLGTPPGETRTIPVYTSDGQTEIGPFLIGSPVDEADTRRRRNRTQQLVLAGTYVPPAS